MDGICKLSRRIQLTLCLCWLSLLFLACSTTPTPTCQSNTDCQPQQECREGTCRSVSPQEASAEAPQEAAQETTQEPAAESQQGEESSELEPANDAGPPIESLPEATEQPPQRCKKDERRPCYTGPANTKDEGECSAGIQFCLADGSWTECRNQTTPTPERCDGKDNDCNGQIDDGLRPTPCTRQQGVCKGSVQRCDGAKGWRTCKADDYKTHNAAYEPLETSCDGKDNDCDGQVDVLAYTETCKLAGAKSDCALGHSICDKSQKLCKSIYKALPFEICQNKVDDDCDGTIDEATACPSVSLSGKPVDYSIGGNGTVLTILPKLEIQCLLPSGTSFKPQPAFSLDPVQDRTNVSNWTIHGVWHLPKSDRHLVIWTYTIRTPQPPWQTKSYFQIFDNQCKPVGSRQLINQALRAVAVSPNDSIVMLAHQGQTSAFIKFDANGKRQSQTLNLYPVTGSVCFRSGKTTHLALAVNEKGQGVLVCHEESTTLGVYFRRFNITTMTYTDPKFTELANSKSNASSPLDASINAQGAFLISWKGRSTVERLNAFFDASGKRQALVRLPLGRHGKVKPGRMGNDFVWGNEDKAVWYRYNAQGQKLAQATGKFEQVRQSPKGKLYALERTPSYRLVANAISLATPTCQGKPCVCTPYSQQDCLTDSGVARAKLPCKMGRQVCRPDGQGWGPCQGEILREAEQCNDQVDNDCDGQVDEECSSLTVRTPPDLHTFDVDNAGNMVTIQWAGLSLVGHCYRSDRSVKRAAFHISTPLPMPRGYSLANPTLRMARQSGHFLAMWTEPLPSGKRDMFRLYNSDCLPVTPPLVWAPSPKHGYQLLGASIDDNGNFALVGQDDNKKLTLKLYNNLGKQVGKALLVEPTGKLCYNGLAQVALHPTKMTGLVLCHQGNTTSVGGGLYLRRFDDKNGFLDAAPQFLDPQKVAAIPRDGVRLAINSQGAYAIRWRVASSANIAFFNSSGKLLKVVAYESFQRTTKWSLSRHARLLRWGDDFVVHAPAPGVLKSELRWYRFSATGTLVSKASIQRDSKSYHIMAEWRDSLRVSSQATFIQLDRSIHINRMTFK